MKIENGSDKRLAIVSAYDADQPIAANIKETNRLRRELEHLEIPHVMVSGSYKGVEEVSYLLNVDDGGGLLPADNVSIGRAFGQESILWLGPTNRFGRRIATLYYTDGRSEAIGLFGAAPEEVAKAQDAWTFDGEYYYIVR